MRTNSRLTGLTPFSFWMVAISTWTLITPLQSYADEYNIIENSLESRTLRLPKISIDNLDYKTLSFVYAVSGDFKILKSTEHEEIVTCDKSVRPNKYLEIEHIGPQISFVVMDKKRLKALYEYNFKGQSSHYFNQNNCHNETDIQQLFKAQSPEWIKEIKAKMIRQAINKIEQFITNDTAPTHHYYTLSLFDIKSEKPEDEALSKAYELAAEGFRLNSIYSLTFSGMKKFRQAAQNWEGELRRIKNKGEEYSAIRLAIHRNLVMTYFFAANYENALYHNEKALALGLDANNSFESTIKDYLHSHKLSPASANDIVHQLNSWRMGREIVQHSQLKEVALSELLPHDSQLSNN